MGDEPRTPAPAPLMPPPPPGGTSSCQSGGAGPGLHAAAAAALFANIADAVVFDFVPGRGGVERASSIARPRRRYCARRPSRRARCGRRARTSKMIGRPEYGAASTSLLRRGRLVKRSASTPSLSQRDITESADSSPKSPPRPCCRRPAPCSAAEHHGVASARQARARLGLADKIGHRDAARGHGHADDAAHQ